MDNQQNVKKDKKITAKSLIEKGKKAGSLTLGEIMEAFAETELDKDQVENLYETLGHLGIEVIEQKNNKADFDFGNDDLEVGDIDEESKEDDEDVELMDLQNIDLSLPKGISIDDPVRMYQYHHILLQI